MKNKIKIKLELFNKSYEETTGIRFTHFYCPFLLLDEKTEIIEAHIINQAFNNTARSWTIQRKDIDGFFGRIFEANFVKLDYKIKGLSPEQVIGDRKLESKLKPKFIHKGILVDHYYSKSNNTPDNVSIVQFENKSEKIVLKVNPTELSDDIELEINLDLRLSATVSLLKAAYLTLFEMSKYNYALSPGGKFLGCLLGGFYKANKDEDKDKILQNAKLYFEKYAHLVKPVEKCKIGLKGTIKDKKAYLAITDNIYWGCIVLY